MNVKKTFKREGEKKTLGKRQGDEKIAERGGDGENIRFVVPFKKNGKGLKDP